MTKEERRMGANGSCFPLLNFASLTGLFPFHFYFQQAMDTLVAASTSIHYVAAKALAGSFAAKNPNP